MRIAAAVLALALLAVPISFSPHAAFGQPTPSAHPPLEGDGPGVAVVELFTSEGCSSCPPADALLGAISAEDPRVIGLSFHVDYWDHLGWRDPYSDAAYSSRQRAYARAFESRGVYTPQAVINGAVHVVGSRRRALRRAMDRAIARGSGARMELTADVSGRMAIVRHRVRGAPTGHRLFLALTESGLRGTVTRGENEGETLHHDHVVRVFVRAPSLDGVTRIAIPGGVALSRVAVVGLVQEPSTMQMSGAAQVRPRRAADGTQKADPRRGRCFADTRWRPSAERNSRQPLALLK